LLALIEGGVRPAEIAWRHDVNTAWSAVLIQHAFAGQPLEKGICATIESGAGAKLPVSAKDLMPRLQGVAIGKALEKLARAWIDSDFALTHSELMALLGNEG